MSNDINKPASGAPKDTHGSQSISDSAAVDLVAAILRAYGRYAITSDKEVAAQLEDNCEQWARHLLVGAPPPDGKGAPGQASWEGVRRFFTNARRSEQDAVNARFNDFRDMLWMFIQGVLATFVEDQAADKKVSVQLDHLKYALEKDSIDTLRREVLGSLEIIGRTFEERSKRQALQMQQLGDQLKHLREELISAQQAMSLDSLTRLYNRASFDEMLTKTVQLSLLSGQNACMLMVDVDEFKAINDNHGHQAGDATLTTLARLMLRAFPRKADFVARYAGDEFIVILQDTSGKEGGVLADRLVKAVRTTVIKLQDQKEIACTISVGVAAIRKGDTPESWLSRADEAMYDAKQAGRNRVASQNGSQ